MGIEDSKPPKSVNIRDYLDRKAQAHRDFDEQLRVFDQELEDLARQLFALIPTDTADLIKETIIPDWLKLISFSHQELLEVLNQDNSVWLQEQAQTTKTHENNCMRKWLAELEEASNNNQKVKILIKCGFNRHEYDIRCKSMAVLAESWAGIIDIEIDSDNIDEYQTSVTFKLLP